MHIGGVERSLVGLLRVLNPAKLDVDLQLYEVRGELLTHVPKWVKTLPSCVAYEMLMAPMKDTLHWTGFLIGVARILARSVIVLRRLLGLPSGFLLARSHRYALPMLPPLGTKYDLAISFMMPHDFVAEKVNARRKVGWIHTDYTSVETGVAVGFEQKGWAKMDQIVAVSTEVAASFTKVFPELATRVIVIENMLDPAWVRMRANEQEPIEMQEAASKGYLILCSVGRFSHAKGFDIAAEAARKLKDKGIKFRWYIIGFGPDESLIRRKIDELGVREEFILLGSRENPYPYMKACDIYIQPSRYEGKAVSIREAQMLGKPVLVSDFSTVRSQIEHGVDGYIVPAGIDGLVEGIQLLSSDKVLCSFLAETAAEREYGNLSEAQKVLDLVPKL
jgi:glycosyltransferase involved in cell wall biosynthesis